jgi:hypothetical protein
MFESFLKRVETGLDRIVSGVDSVIAQSLDTSSAVTSPSNSLSIKQSSVAPLTAAAGQSISLKRNVSLFRSSLYELALDPANHHAALCPQLYTPGPILQLLTYLSKHVDTPALFRERVTVREVDECKRVLERERSLPVQLTVPVAAHSLVQWLLQLPEPLLGADLYDSLLQCELIDEDAEVVAALVVLVEH